MQQRASEYAELGINARWLSSPKAENAYRYALAFSSTERYGLNPSTVANVDRLVIESHAMASEWLKNRVSATGTVQIVYSETEVCVIDASAFLAQWQQIFVPARDDAIILHNLEPTVAFYCHEEELEVGRR